MPDPADYCQWGGCLLGLGGAGLLALKNRLSGYGFVLFLLSNIAWIAFGFLTQATGIIVMQIGFTLTSLVGVWQWLVVPRHELSTVLVDNRSNTSQHQFEYAKE